MGVRSRARVEDRRLVSALSVNVLLGTPLESTARACKSCPPSSSSSSSSTTTTNNNNDHDNTNNISDTDTDTNSDDL